MTDEVAAFISGQTVLTQPSAVPELTLHLATEVTPLWKMTEERLKQNGLAPPYWAFAWPGGQGMARYIIDNPEVVEGKRVLDFAAGGGVAAIAAMMSGAQKVVAAEIDPMAIVAIKMNAAHNKVDIQTCDEIDLTKPYKNIDLIIAGDVCYQQAMATKMMRWLWVCIAKGTRVLLADPGRAYIPHDGLSELARYEVPTSRDLEDRDSRTVTIWDVALPTE